MPLTEAETAKTKLKSFEKLSEDFGRLYLSDELSDVELLIDGETIPCHKAVLTTRSEYFRALLCGSFSESDKKQVPLEVPLIAFKKFLKYMYTAEIDFRSETSEVLGILALSHMFQCQELGNEIQNFLKKSLKLGNVCQIFEPARLYDLSDLTQECLNLIDNHSTEILEESFFSQLSKHSLIMLLKRDSFCAPELAISEAVAKWIRNKSDLTLDDITEVTSVVRLAVISKRDLLFKVRPMSVFDCKQLLDAFHLKYQDTLFTRLCRGKTVFEENVATTNHGAKIIHGKCSKFSILDPFKEGRVTYAIHTITHPVEANGIVIELSDVFIVNHIKLELDIQNHRSYSYYVEVSVEKKYWERVVDFSAYKCRFVQYLYFDKRPLKYIKIVGTHSTVGAEFILHAFEVMLAKNTPRASCGIISPTENVALYSKSAVVLQGSNNDIINGNWTNYEGHSGYTCHDIGNGSILIQLGQPYNIGIVKMLLWDLDDRTYGFYINTSSDGSNWTTVVDKSEEKLRSWQKFAFGNDAINFIRIVGTHNSANTAFHVVHLECYSR